MHLPCGLGRFLLLLVKRSEALQLVVGVAEIPGYLGM